MSTARAALDEKTPVTSSNANANAQASGSTVAPLSFGDSKHTKSTELTTISGSNLDKPNELDEAHDSDKAGSLRLVSLHVPYECRNSSIAPFTDRSSMTYSADIGSIGYNDHKKHWQTVPFLSFGGGEYTILPNRKYAFFWKNHSSFWRPTPKNLTLYVIELSSMKCQWLSFHSEIYNISPLPDEKHILISYENARKQLSETDSKLDIIETLDPPVNFQIWDITDPFNGKLKFDFYREGLNHLAKLCESNKILEICNGTHLFSFICPSEYAISHGKHALIKIFNIKSGKAIETATHELRDLCITHAQLLNGFLILTGSRRNFLSKDLVLQIWNISNVNKIFLLEEFLFKQGVRDYYYKSFKPVMYFEENGNIRIGRHITGKNTEAYSTFLYESSLLFQKQVKDSLTELTLFPKEIINLISDCFLPASFPPIEYKTTITTSPMTKWETNPLQLLPVTFISEEKDAVASPANKKTLESILKLILLIKKYTEGVYDRIKEHIEKLENIIKNSLLHKPIQIQEKKVAFITLEIVLKLNQSIICNLFSEKQQRYKIINFEEIILIKKLILKYYPTILLEINIHSIESRDDSRKSLTDALFSQSYDMQSLMLIDEQEKQKFVNATKNNALADSKAINTVRNLSRYAKSKTSFLRNISCFQDPDTDKNTVFSKIDLELKAEQGKPQIALLEKTLLKKIVEIFTTAMRVRLGVTNDRTDSAEALVDLLSGKTTGNDIISAEDVTAIRGLLTKYSNTMIMDYEALKAFVVEMNENFQKEVGIQSVTAVRAPA